MSKLPPVKRCLRAPRSAANNYFPQSFLADGCSCCHIKQIRASSMVIRSFRNWCSVNIALMSAIIIFSSNWAGKFYWKDVWKCNVRECHLWNMSSHPAEPLNVVQSGCIKVFAFCCICCLWLGRFISRIQNPLCQLIFQGTHCMTEDGEIRLYSLSSFQALLSIDGLPIKAFHTWMEMWGMVKWCWMGWLLRVVLLNKVRHSPCLCCRRCEAICKLSLM